MSAKDARLRAEEKRRQKQAAKIVKLVRDEKLSFRAAGAKVGLSGARCHELFKRALASLLAGLTTESAPLPPNPQLKVADGERRT